MLKNIQSKLLYSIFNEIRISILNQLLLKEENIADLSKKLKIERSKLCYHLNILANEKILNSKYIILEKARSKGKAGKVYSVNPNKFKEAKKVLEDFKNEVDKLGS